MKHLLLTTIAAVVLVGCGEAQSPEPPTAKAPDISIYNAVEEENIEAVKQAIAAGAGLNAKRDDGWTPLHMVACTGHKEIAELLIAAGADLNVKDDDGYTPLHAAATFVDTKEIVELLIAKGADVNAKGDGAGTPLDVAIWASNTVIADLLRKHGGKTKKELEAAGK